MRVRDYVFDELPALRHLEVGGHGGARPDEITAGKLFLTRAIAQATDLTYEESRALVGLVMDLQWHILMRGWFLRLSTIGSVGLRVKPRLCNGAIVGEAAEIRLQGRASDECKRRWRAQYLDEWRRRRAADIPDLFGPSDAPWLDPDGKVHLSSPAEAAWGDDGRDPQR